MLGELRRLTIHVPNVWQTYEWYRQVFGLTADLASDATSARFAVPGHLLTFVAHQAQEEAFGTRRLNSFLSDPPALHLTIATADVAALFAHALAHGAVAVLDPLPEAAGRIVASLRDLNGILIQLVEDKEKSSDFA